VSPGALYITLLAYLLAMQGCFLPRVPLGPGTILGEGGLRNYNQPELDRNDVHLTRAALSRDFAELATECWTVFKVYEAPVLGLGISSVSIAVIGAAAGAIGVPALTAVAPMANRGAIAILGGVSGVTNTLQEAMKQERLTSDEARITRDEMRKKWQAAVDAYTRAGENPKDPNGIEQRREAIQAAAAACITYAAFNPFIKPTKTEGIQRPSRSAAASQSYDLSILSSSE
jgi:hypothetical protein